MQVIFLIGNKSDLDAQVSKQLHVTSLDAVYENVSESKLHSEHLS